MDWNQILAGSATSLTVLPSPAATDTQQWYSYEHLITFVLFKNIVLQCVVLSSSFRFIRVLVKFLDCHSVTALNYPLRVQPVEHPHGGGNHQHIGKASTVARDKSAGRKVRCLQFSACFCSLLHFWEVWRLDLRVTCLCVHDLTWHQNDLQVDLSHHSTASWLDWICSFRVWVAYRLVWYWVCQRHFKQSKQSDWMSTVTATKNKKSRFKPTKNNTKNMFLDVSS